MARGIVSVVPAAPQPSAGAPIIAPIVPPVTAAVSPESKTTPEAAQNLARPTTPLAAPLSPTPVVVAARKRQSLPDEPSDRAQRKLTDEERQHRRLRRNIITASLCLAVLLIVMAILLKLGG